MSSDLIGGRRSFFGWLIGLGSVAAAGVAAVPGLGYLLDPLLRPGGGGGQWRKVTRLTRLGETPVAVPVVGDQVDAWRRTPARRLGTVWMRKTASGEVHALSAECPHLGCSLGFDADRKAFVCPCHESSFELTGESQGGPAPRGMDPLEVRIDGDDVEVRFVRFRTQIPGRQELG